MGAGHSLHHPGSSVVHRLPAHVKIVVTFLLVLAVVATPREAFWIFGEHLGLLVGIWVAARLPVASIAVRSLIEAPFVVLAVLLPFAAAGPRVEWLGLSLSYDGLLAGWNILVKGTLGVLISVTLGMTTPVRDLLSGLGRLRVPGMVTTIATLMVRYLEVIVAEARRMRLARVARGHDPRFLWQIGPTVRGVGTLFLRSYERGERVHLAMLARGYTGAMPVTDDAGATRRTWARALVPAVVAVLGAATGYALT
ncbi:cobalt ECF transporter T component CbiQ [Actinomycetospora endophytica]|uniref:Cobalt ECF transporter T component CbiQ n=1 Tax=Actinomycetospora endophytica TaxID=2291215 RepID=A0ABS8PA97_9PSEU|nr:cobalt ECF transporter T component CbiQ [Actinomycetospora endophytica]MCD2193914.1 cobalt ECF transporter T component CbiQ [Actinomycetospora endophytica]